MSWKNIVFDRTDIYLNNKPEWLNRISPKCQVPVVQVGHDDWLFGAGGIAGYLDRIPVPPQVLV
ncbi:hypothetical protein [Pseudosulfitobacter pseudonitzschiae]|uniref:hypothetical protein n=1 Tax=Pseudosulfitobacter pseudonitzschiae TaxID=1402135 RepID=UPI0032E87F91